MTYIIRRRGNALLAKRILQFLVRKYPQVTPQDEMSKIIVDFCNEPRTRREIADKCGLKSPSYLSRKYLNPLLEQKLLYLTIPEKPNSSKQKYVANPSREESVRFDDPSNVTN